MSSGLRILNLLVVFACFLAGLKSWAVDRVWIQDREVCLSGTPAVRIPTAYEGMHSTVQMLSGRMIVNVIFPGCGLISINYRMSYTSTTLIRADLVSIVGADYVAQQCNVAARSYPMTSNYRLETDRLSKLTPVDRAGGVCPVGDVVITEFL